jgi:hypothetical protein
VIHKTRELHELVLRNVEVGICLYLFVVFSHCPSHSEHWNAIRMNQGSIFPSFVVKGNWVRLIITNILVLITKWARIINDYVRFSLTDLLEDIESWNSSKLLSDYCLIFEVKVTEMMEDCICFLTSNVILEKIAHLWVIQSFKERMSAIAQIIDLIQTAIFMHHLQWKSLRHLVVDKMEVDGMSLKECVY